jgi:uncharacterized protein YlxP (DUF503 family)
MSVALCNLTLRLPENGSLKGKRQVVKSIQQRLHNRFNVSDRRSPQLSAFLGAHQQT